MNMNQSGRIIFALVAAIGIALAPMAAAQTDDAEELKLAALEALISAPPERALPLAVKALQGDHSDEIKSRALFVLSQIDLPEAQNIVIDTAVQGSGETQVEAIRMVGIVGDVDGLDVLVEVYEVGDEEVREAVLEAYVIADDRDAVYDLAVRVSESGSEKDFESAVEILGAMGAREHLRKLRESTGISETLIEAYAISGDSDSLRELALDSSEPELQMQAIEALGIVGGGDVNTTLIEIYRSSDSEEVRESALEGMMISGYDEGVLELYRSSQDPAEKRELLEYLVMMGSDDLWDIIDSTLDGGF